MSNDTAALNLLLPVETKEKLKEYCEVNRMSQTRVIAELIENNLYNPTRENPYDVLASKRDLVMALHDFYVGSQAAEKAIGWDYITTRKDVETWFAAQSETQDWEKLEHEDVTRSDIGRALVLDTDFVFELSDDTIAYAVDAVTFWWDAEHQIHMDIKPVSDNWSFFTLAAQVSKKESTYEVMLDMYMIGDCIGDIHAEEDPALSLTGRMHAVPYVPCDMLDKCCEVIDD